MGGTIESHNVGGTIESHNTYIICIGERINYFLDWSCQVLYLLVFHTSRNVYDQDDVFGHRCGSYVPGPQSRIILLAFSILGLIGCRVSTMCSLPTSYIDQRILSLPSFIKFYEFFFQLCRNTNKLPLFISYLILILYRQSDSCFGRYVGPLSSVVASGWKFAIAPFLTCSFAHINAVCLAFFSNITPV